MPYAAFLLLPVGAFRGREALPGLRGEEVPGASGQALRRPRAGLQARHRAQLQGKGLALG